ncbi:hypothetical protein F1N41_01515 [Campylobacter jejuni]|nr:hypothetical protein [Campylobacter jejuni]EAL7208524.1 hypothetical protein [Campylobacter coli]EAJ4536823.1 hypothetical protein [Campylobacter jejuni]EAJ9204327.1 hypothetical protein [Campylobacter jejuni]EAK7623286.1 hypothetical protein [Campylobacter jejuni]
MQYDFNLEHLFSCKKWQEVLKCLPFLKCIVMGVSRKFIASHFVLKIEYFIKLQIVKPTRIPQTNPNNNGITFSLFSRKLKNISIIKNLFNLNYNIKESW